MPTLIKLILFGFIYLGLFLLWIASIQGGFGIDNVARFTTVESEVAWGVPLLALVVSPLLFRYFSRYMDAWNDSLKESEQSRRHHEEQERNADQ